MILEAKEDCNELTFSWTTASAPVWSIQVEWRSGCGAAVTCWPQVIQISCTDPWRPPSGCLQHFTGKVDKRFSSLYCVLCVVCCVLCCVLCVVNQTPATRSTGRLFCSPHYTWSRSPAVCLVRRHAAGWQCCRTSYNLL